MSMSEQAKQARRAYQAKWRAENRDKVRQHERTYWEKKAREAKAEEAKEQKRA